MLFRSKPENIDLKFLAIVYDSSVVVSEPRLTALPLRCYLTASIIRRSRIEGLREDQIHSWIPHDLQPGLQWHPIPGGLYGSEQFMSDCDGCGQRRLHTLLGQVPANNAKRLEVTSCFL